MIPKEIVEVIQQVKKLKVKNTVDCNYRFYSDTNTLFIPISEINFAKQFKDFRNLEEIELDICNEIKDTHAMFYNCINLKKIVFTEKLNLEYAYDLAYLFYNCSSLVEIDLSNITIGGKILYLNHMFYSCSSLKMINFGNSFHNKNIRSVSHMLYNCKKLKQLDLSDINFNNISDFHHMFKYTNPDLEVLVNNTFKEEMLL